MELLDDCSVLEVGEYVAVPYAGKLFSDLGGDVLKLEPPEGDVARRVGPFPDTTPSPDSSGFFAYLNTGKRSVTLPENGALAREVIERLIEERDVDLVIEDRLDAYGIDPRRLAAEHDGLSVVSVSGFGATGPWRDHEAPDLIAWAESGHMNKCGYPDSAPTRPRIKTTDYWAGQVAANGAIAALLDRDLQGGDGQHVDVSKRDAALSTMEYFIVGYSYTGATTQRTGPGYPDQGIQKGFTGIFEARDGYFSGSVIGNEWGRFCEGILDRPDLVEDERFETQGARRENIEDIEELVEGYTRDRGRWELLEEFQEAGLPSTITATPEDIVGFEQLDAREFWQEVPLASGETVTMPGFPFRVDDRTVGMERAPRLGEHDASVYADLGYDTDSLASTARSSDASLPAGGTPETTEPEGDGSRPLSGVRILDFTWIMAGPFGSKFLAALGADVVKVESMQKPDGHRAAMTFQYESTPTSGVSAFFNETNQGKRSIRLDLTNERGRRIALDMAREADVVMENYSPTFMERVDFDYETVREVNPEIVYLSMPGWGKEGPARSYRSYGFNLQSMAGLDHISGHPDDPPTPSGHSWPDPTAGYTGALAVQMALRRRERTGEGAYIELPQFEMAVTFLHKPLMDYTMNGRSPERTGNRDEDGRFVQDAYRCAGEDRWVVVAIETDEQWRRLCSLVGRPDLVDDDRFSSQYARLRNQDALGEVIEGWTARRSAEEARSRLRKRGIPAGIVADERDLVEYDPQLRAREYFHTHDHPEVGEQRYLGVPFRMSRSETRLPSRAPLFGEHTDEVLSEWLGFSGEKLADAREADALY